MRTWMGLIVAVLVVICEGCGRSAGDFVPEPACSAPGAPYLNDNEQAALFAELLSVEERDPAAPAAGCDRFVFEGPETEEFVAECAIWMDAAETCASARERFERCAAIRLSCPR